LSGVVIRPAAFEDLNSILQVEATAWPKEIQASAEQFLERLRIYPQGFAVATQGPVVVGVLTSQRVQYQLGQIPEGWERTTNRGWIRQTHQVDGNALYIVSVGIDSEHQSRRIGSALVRGAQEHAVQAQLQYVLLDSRLPDFRKSGFDDLERYVLSTVNGERIDPELRFYERLDFQLLGVNQIISSCMLQDAESGGFGVRLVWVNQQKPHGNP
jgi:ribosomal protein S18 acetylase RimI-like enzyme